MLKSRRPRDVPNNVGRVSPRKKGGTKVKEEAVKTEAGGWERKIRNLFAEAESAASIVKRPKRNARRPVARGEAKGGRERLS